MDWYCHEFYDDETGYFKYISYDIMSNQSNYYSYHPKLSVCEPFDFNINVMVLIDDNSYFDEKEIRMFYLENSLLLKIIEKI